MKEAYNAILEKLSSRGFWRVEIRPITFQSDRIAGIRDLRELIDRARVELRGWDFPHRPQDWGVPESLDWIGHGIDWSVHVEVWRAYRSGQFVYRGGVWTDWLDQALFGTSGFDVDPGQALPIIDSLWSLTEYYEFAARWAQSQAGEDKMRIEVSFHGLEGRELLGDDRRRHWSGPLGPAKAETFRSFEVVERARLVSEPRKLAVNCASALFEAFGYAPSQGLLESMQEGLFESRHR